MDIIFVVICLIMAAVGLGIEKKLFNPVTVFCGLWAVIIGLSLLHLHNLDLAEDWVYLYIISGVLSFFIGYLFAKFGIKNKVFVIRRITSARNVYSCDYCLNRQLVVCLLIISIPFALKDLVSVIGLIGMGNDLGSVQKLLQGTENVFIRTALENAIRTLILNPFWWICGPIAVVDFWIGKRDKKLLILTATVILIRILTTGGRALFIQVAFYFVCVFTLSQNKSFKQQFASAKRAAKKNKRLFRILFLMCVIVLAGLTYSRAGEAALKTIYYDFAMQPMMFQKWSAEADNTVIGFGAATLNGLFSTLDYILRNTIRIALPQRFQDISALITATDMQWMQIGSTVRANAYVSVFWAFYVDGRYFGILLGSFIYGAWCRQAYYKMMKNINAKSLAVYCMVIIGVFYSFGRCEFSYSSYVLGFMYLVLFFYRKKQVKYNVRRKVYCEIKRNFSE